MLEHKHPGKGSHAGGGHDHDHGHGGGPGKRTRVEQAVASASAAAMPSDGGGVPETSAAASKTLKWHEGQVLINETVAVKLSHGRGPVSIDISKGGMQIGTNHVSADFKSPGAATGRSLGLSGASATAAKQGSHKSAVKIQDGYVGVEYSTSWSIKGKGWSGTLSISAFVGARPPPPKKHGPLRKVIDAIGHAVEAAAHAVVDLGEAITDSAPEWGPVLLTALAAAAAAGEAAATG